ncbi:MAG: NepR family anti-sigma factor [Kiloniellaceae bacterium]
MPEDDSNSTPDRQGPAGAPRKAPRKADAGKQDWIGAHLRKVYDEALNEPVPDRFLTLLKQIDQKERGS